MKETTRIHIAKVSYDIELEAKKMLEKYNTKLELYADEELLQDVEIRMTELLDERGVHEGGVITREDVAAIRKQLGEPKEFLGEGDIAIGSDIEMAIDAPKRLYRDMDHAVLGGVLSGIAGYLGVSMAWVRVVFLVLLIVSFGSAALVYCVLWLVVPLARTAAEKLQLTGTPVTLASIRELNNSNETIGENKTAQLTQQLLFNLLGILSAVAAVVALLATIWGGVGIVWAGSPLAAAVPIGSFAYWFAYTLFVLSGVLLTLLFSLVAYTLFKKKLTKKVGRLVVGTILAGVLSFGSGVGLVLYSNWSQTNYAVQSTSTSRVDLPNEFAAIKKLTITTNAHVEYIADGKQRYELTAATDDKPVITISADGREATLLLQVSYMDDVRNRYVEPSLTVHGPGLTEVVLSGGGSAYYYNENHQEALTAIARTGSLKVNGTYKQVTAKTSDSGQVLLDVASIDRLEAATESGSITAGVVRELTIAQPEVCAATTTLQDSVEVGAVTSGSMTYNGSLKQAVTYRTLCGEVIFGRG